jgi:hypothetical protein
MFHNQILSFDDSTYSIHVNRGAHTSFFVPFRQMNWYSLQNMLISLLVDAFTPDKKCLGYGSHPTFFVFLLKKAPFVV